MNRKKDKRWIVKTSFFKCAIFHPMTLDTSLYSFSDVQILQKQRDIYSYFHPSTERDLKLIKTPSLYTPHMRRVYDSSVLFKIYS